MIKLGNDPKSNEIKAIIAKIDSLREDIDTQCLKYSAYGAEDKTEVAEGMGIAVEDLQAIINSFTSWKNAINGISCQFVGDLIYLSKYCR